MKKTLAIPPLVALASPFVLAGGKGYGMWYVYKGLAFFLVFFLCCIIFWWTHVWIVKNKGKLGKKK